MPGEETSSSDPRAVDLESERLDRARHGLIAVLFADLVGSTALLRGLGERGGRSSTPDLPDLLRRQVRRWGGREVKALGDGLLVAFPTAASAISAAAGMQQDLLRHNAMPGAVPLAVRVGVHAGEPLEDDAGDLVGLAGAVAHRLCEAAAGGKILVSETARACHYANGSTRCGPVGRLLLKGVGERIGAYEVLWSAPATQATRRAPPASDAARATGARPVLRAVSSRRASQTRRCHVRHSSPRCGRASATASSRSWRAAG